jgi:hypothetical protein
MYREHVAGCIFIEKINVEYLATSNRRLRFMHTIYCIQN